MEIKTNSKELMKKLLLICESQKEMWEYTTDKPEELGKMARMGDMCYVRLAPDTQFERGQHVIVRGL